MKKAVLFDLDGTLVNSIYDIGDAMNHALTQLGQPVFTTQQYYHLVGNGMKKLCQRGIFQNEGGEVTSLISRDEFVSAQSRRFVEESFDGSLPAFIAAFSAGKGLTPKEIAQIRAMIDEMEG